MEFPQLDLLFDMKTKSKVEETAIDTAKLEEPAIDIAEKIKNGELLTKKVNNKQFFHSTRPGKYVIDQDKRLQVRKQDVDYDFIERQVEKNTPHLLDKKVIIFFPSDVYDINGKIFAREGDMKIVGGNHTSVIEIELGIFESDAYLINFDTQLGGKISEALDLGNLLNVIEREQRGVEKNDVRNIVMQLMDENEEETGEAELTQKQKDRIVNSYDFINYGTIGQWKSYHATSGGRRKPKKTYTDSELADKWKHYGDQEQYRDYIVIEPRALESWKQTAISTAVTEHLSDKNMDSKGNTIKNKILFIFHCSTQKQADNKETIKKAMKKHYGRIEKRYGLKIKSEFLRHE